jgi:hypothetical protein
MKRITKIIYPVLGMSALICFALLPEALAAPEKAPVAPETALPGFNTADGDHALFSITTGVANVAVGWYSLFSDTDGSFNTAVGAGTLLFNVGDQSTSEGVQNTAVGAAALLFNTTGSFNAAFGDIALINNTIGHRNTALGSRALTANITGFQNTGLGRSALLFNTDGHDNVGIGVDAIQDNTVGINNVAIGNFALLNVLGNNNTGTGFAALGGNAPVDGIGENNTANGINALTNNTDGGGNTAIGAYTLQSNTTSFNNTAIGANALLNSTLGDGNIAVGINAGANLTSGDLNIYIGSQGAATESNTIRIGDTEGVPSTATYISGISGTPVVGDAVVVDANGQLGTVASSQRFKTAIKPMDNASEAILALRPVTFRYKEEIDSKGAPQFGLLAEEVAKVNPNLVVRDRNGKIYSVRYEAVNAMLLNEFLKEHQKVAEQDRKLREQEATIAQLKSSDVLQQQQMKALAVTVKEQASQIQEVSAQLELIKTAPQTVANR